MKKPLKSYISFSRTERVGIIGLCSLLLLLITIRATMPLWVHPNFDTEKEQKLAAAWESFKQQHPSATTDRNTIPPKEHQDASDENTTPLADTIDLNTADSATLVRLKGIGPVTAGKIVAWRKKHGQFTHVEQIKETGGFNKNVFDLLKKHLVVKTKQR